MIIFILDFLCTNKSFKFSHENYNLFDFLKFSKNLICFNFLQSFSFIFTDCFKFNWYFLYCVWEIFQRILWIYFYFQVLRIFTEIATWIFVAWSCVACTDLCFKSPMACAMFHLSSIFTGTWLPEIVSCRTNLTYILYFFSSKKRGSICIKVKICDFGMSRQFSQEQPVFFGDSLEPIPVRWSAPEVCSWMLI